MTNRDPGALSTIGKKGRKAAVAEKSRRSGVGTPAALPTGRGSSPVGSTTSPVTILIAEGDPQSRAVI
jgi:hypothetical protein